MVSDKIKVNIDHKEHRQCTVTLVADSVDARLQKGGKNVVNIHITMNYKVC